jgi:DNA segregation ATPase FtsK/SpoIIIE, S-DNA-T family
MAADSIPVAPLSIWNPVHLGTDELGNRVEVTLAERNMLIGGEPGGGKSVALQLIVAHGALSADCRLVLVDGKRVELGLWRDCAERFIGPSVDDAIDTLHWLQDQIDQRTGWLLDHKMRKITPDLGWPVYLMPIDEVAYYSATVGTNVQQKEFNACNRDIVARGRAPGIIPVEATQRPSADIIPTSLRDLFGYRWAFRCSTEASSDTILGHGAGPTPVTRPPRSTRRPAACPGCAPRTASRAGSRPPTYPMRRSSTSPGGRPRPAPPTPLASTFLMRAR